MDLFFAIFYKGFNKESIFFEHGKVWALVKICFVFVFASETHSMLTPLGSKRNSASAHGRSLITGSEFFPASILSFNWPFYNSVLEKLIIWEFSENYL